MKSILTSLLVLSASYLIGQTKTFKGYITEVQCIDFCDVFLKNSITNQEEVVRMHYESDGRTMKVNKDAVDFFTIRENDFQLKPEYKDKVFIIATTKLGEDYIINNIKVEGASTALQTNNNQLSVPSGEFIKVDYIVSYTPSTFTQYGLNKAKSKDVLVTGKFTESNPLIVSKATAKSKSGQDSTYISSFLTGEFKDGVPIGLIKSYSFNGSIFKLFHESEINTQGELIKYTSYSNDMFGPMEVETIEFASACPIKYTGTRKKITYEKGQVIKYEELNEKGIKTKDFTYVVNPEKIGKCNYEYKVEHVSGLQNGVSKQWDNEGKIKFESTYLKGKKNGIDYEYKSGKLVLYTTYKDGLKHGKAVVYKYEDGYGPTNKDGGHTFQEVIYENGVYKSGTAYRQDGKTVPMNK